MEKNRNIEIDALRERILAQMDLSRDTSDPELRRLIQEEVSDYGRKYLLTLSQRAAVETRVFNSLRRMDILQELLDQDDITEIMVNGPDHIFYERNGRIYPWEKSFESKEKLENVIQQIAAMANKAVNEADPIVDTRLADGSRVNAVLHPAALGGPYLTIRKFSARPVSLENLIELNSLSKEISRFLVLLVKAGYNLFISGGTGSGKTTLLNALSQVIPEEDRVVTIEDSAELQLRSVKNLVRLETRTMNVNGSGEITIRHLIRNALRMRPDRLIVGEVRGAEALDLLQALNTGHDGGLSTGHGNSCRDMLARLETMVLMGLDLPVGAVRGQISSGIDIMIHLGRLRDKTRKVLEISEINGMRHGEIVLNSLYQFREQISDKDQVKGCWKCTGMLQNREKLERSGWDEAFDFLYKTKENKEEK